ncbi:MAG: hypothetical protein E6Q97_34180, partial [Desulfurellales bacterium]
MATTVRKKSTGRKSTGKSAGTKTPEVKTTGAESESKTPPVIDLEKYTLPEGHVLCLRSNKADMRSYNDFQWPESGEVAAPDWKKKKDCGNGLHGLLWGMGDSSLLYRGEDAKWLVVETPADGVIDLDRKVKFPRGVVVYCGNLIEAANLISRFAPVGTLPIGGTATAGYSGTATAGDWGTATAGDWGTATAGDWGTATAGYRGTATAGD